MNSHRVVKMIGSYWVMSVFYLEVNRGAGGIGINDEGVNLLVSEGWSLFK